MTTTTFDDIEEMLATRTGWGLQTTKMMLDALSTDEVQQVLDGNRARYHHLITESIAGRKLSRSNAYELRRYFNVAMTLHEDGIYNFDTERDVETGRKTKTILREIARLPWDDDIHDGHPQRDELRDIYRDLRSEPIDVVKDVVARVRAHVQTLDRGVA